MNYQPFLIAPFQTGLDTDLSPWLLPQDAFSDIENGHIHHGRIEKRDGYIVHGRMSEGLIITAASGSPAVFTVADATVLNDGDTVTLTGMSGGTWDTLNNSQYLVTSSGATTFQLTTLAGAAVNGGGLGIYVGSTGRLGYYVTDRIMGIYNYWDAINSTRYNLIFSDKRAALYNSTAEAYVPLELDVNPVSDFFSGSDTDFVWATSWQTSATIARFYFTNGKAYQAGNQTDGIMYFDPSTSLSQVTNFRPDIDTSGTKLNGAKLLFVARKRLIALGTYEGSSFFPQRARMSKAGNPDNFDSVTPGSGHFTDAATGESIITARQIYDHIVVFFTNSVWVLVPQGNPSNPYIWKKLNNFRAADAKMSSVDYDQYVLSLGYRGIFTSSISQTQRADARIQDFSDNDIYYGQIGKVFGQREYDNERTWILYPANQDGSTENNSALVLDEDSKAWSKYKIALNCLGYGSQDKDLTAADITTAKGYPSKSISGEDAGAQDFDDDETAFYFSLMNGQELFLGGDTGGYVYALSTGTADNTTSIDFTLQSAEWNPYKDQGKKAQFGYIDIYFKSDQLTDVKVEFFTDKNTAEYAKQTSNLLPELSYVANIQNIVTQTPSTSGITVTAPNHGLTNGDFVYFYKVQGMYQANNLKYTVTNSTTNTFDVTVDASGYSPYTGGGMIFRNEYYETKVWKRFYAGGYGNTHKVKITSSGNQHPLVIHALKPYFRPRGNRTI